MEIFPIMALCLMRSLTYIYYAQNYAGIIGCIVPSALVTFSGFLAIFHQIPDISYIILLYCQNDPVTLEMILCS